MKTKFSMLVLLLGLVVVSSVGNVRLEAAERMSIAVATAKGYVTFKIRGTSSKERRPGSGSHHGECLQMTVTNKSAKQLQLYMESGRVLASVNSNVQDMLVTSTVSLTVDPFKTVTKKLYAMCAQKSNGAPNENESFRIGKMGNSSLIGLAKLIEKKNYQNSAGQSAVWTITDNIPVTSIKSADMAQNKELASYVCKVKNIPLPKEFNTIPGVSQKVMMTVNLGQDDKVSVVVVNQIGIEVKVLMTETLKPSGSHTFSFWIDENELPKGKYWVLVKVGNTEALRKELEI